MVRGYSSHLLRYRSLRSFVHFLKYFNLKRRVFSTTLAPPPKPALFCTAGWEFLWARCHPQLIVNVLNLFSLMLNGLAE